MGRRFKKGRHIFHNNIRGVRTMALQKYTKEWLEELCKDSFSLAEVLKRAGCKQGVGI